MGLSALAFGNVFALAFWTTRRWLSSSGVTPSPNKETHEIRVQPKTKGKTKGTGLNPKEEETLSNCPSFSDDINYFIVFVADGVESEFRLLR